MYYLWVLGRDYGRDPDKMKALADITKIGFSEDEAVIEAVQKNLSRDSRNAEAREVSVPSDAPGIQARRILKRWMEKETA